MSILLYPNPSLLNIPKLITTFDDGLKNTLMIMKSVMVTHNGAGLAANQIGIDAQIFIMQDEQKIIHEFINPKILSTDGSIMMVEGCLSAPSIYLTVARPESVELIYQDASGEPKHIVAQGKEARIILHEMDHLNGEFYFDKVSRKQRKYALSRLKKLT